METLDDVISWFNYNRFVKNPLLTIIIVGGRYNAMRIIAILILNKKFYNMLNSNKQKFINQLKGW